MQRMQQFLVAAIAVLMPMASPPFTARVPRPQPLRALGSRSGFKGP